MEFLTHVLYFIYDFFSFKIIYFYFHYSFFKLKSSTSFVSPGRKSPRVMLPIRTRISLSVGNPTVAVIFRTCLNFPSVMVRDNQLVGPCLSLLIFLVRDSKVGGGSNRAALQALVIYFFPLMLISTPSINCSVASFVISPST